MEQRGAPRQGRQKPILAIIEPQFPWLMIVNLLALSNEGCSLIHRYAMRSLPALLACLLVATASAALADSRVFIIANQSDGYGIDQCLAKGEECGAHAARSYCQSRDFAQATAYRRVDPDEVTGSVPRSGNGCTRAGCGAYVAITCQR
jgi:hypothetical protein